MNRHRLFGPLLGLVLVATACSPAAPGTARSGPSQEQPAAPPRTLNVVIRVEPIGLTESLSTRTAIVVAMFGSSLAHRDPRENPVPVLAQALPVLNTDSWRVFPDGRMETTFKLRPGLIWHDGTPLTAEDFVFGETADRQRSEWGLSVGSVAQRLREEVLAPDSATLVVRWRSPYWDGGAAGPDPYPRHLLEPVFAQGEPDAVAAHPYWTTDHVGIGPFKLDRWERGAFVEAVAFDSYALGRPKIDRVRLTWNDDPNGIVARLLAGDVDIALDGSIQFQHATTLKEQWGNVGVLDFQPGNIRKLDAQNRPEYAQPKAVLDPRAKRAVLHAIDRRELVDALLGPEGIVADTMAPPTVPFYQDLLRVVATYPFDVRRTEQLLGELGFTKGSDGFFASATEGRFAPAVQGVAQGQEGQETTIMADMLRRAGIDASLNLISDRTVQANDEVKSTYPAFRTNYYPVRAGFGQDRNLASRISGPENRWSASNKEGWVNEEHDRWFAVWNRGLDPGERTDALIQMLRIVNDELPVLPLYFDLTVIAHVAALAGPGGPRGPESTQYWNLHEWRWK